MPGRWLAVPLLVLLPLVWRAGLALARLATRDVQLSRFIAPGAALALWLFGVHFAGLVSGSFYTGLYAGTIFAAALGAASLRKTLPADSEGGEAGDLPSWWIWIGMGAAVAVLLGPVLYTSKHDECLITGHVSIPAEMQNGIYPPRHLTFPRYELRYHYGVDLAAAAVSAVLGRLDVALTVHLLALLLWAYSFCLYWLVGERLIGGRLAGPVTATCVLFAGGAPYFCHVTTTLDYFTSMCRRGGVWIVPPMASNFLQHPWSLGLPVFAALLLVWTHRDGRSPASPEPGRNLSDGRRQVSGFAGAWSKPEGDGRWGWLLLGLLACVLSLAQAVLFVCAVPSLVADASLRDRRVSPRALLQSGAWAAAVFVVARLLHGFFAPSAEPSQGRLEWHPFWLDASASDWALWHLEGLGALLPLGIAGLFVLRRQRVLLGLLAFGGLVVRDAFRYTPSWNIVKFAMVSQLALAILTAACVTAALARPRLRVAGAVGLVASTAFGLAWPLSIAATHPPTIEAGQCLPAPLTGADAAAVALLRRRVSAGEAVFRSERADAYAMRAGLPQQTWDWGTQGFGFSDGLYQERRALIAHPDDLEAFRRQGFRWLVLGPRDGHALVAARQWVSEGKAEVAGEFPPLTVFRLR
jgi:hypothetical protein